MIDIKTINAKRKIKISFLLLFLSLQAFSATANEEYQIRYTEADSVKQVAIHFRVNETVIDRSYMDNAKNLELIKRLVTIDTNSKVISVEVTGTTSPEGPLSWNQILVARRVAAIETLFRQSYPEFDATTIRKIAINNGWAAMRNMLENDNNVPNKEQLLAIIDNQSMSDATKEQRVRALGNGAAWEYLKQNTLIYYRTGIVNITIRYATPVAETAPAPTPTPAPAPATTPEQAVVTEPQKEIEPEVEPQKEVEPEEKPEEETPAEPFTAQELTEDAETPYIFAIRTNLLFDLVGAPNLGVEIPVGERFSIAADAAYAYWRINNLYALQTLQAGIEAKYWFNQSRALTGWNAGIYGMYSKRYDVQWKNGYQGDGFWSAGIGAGYAIPISKRLNMEFGLAAGYFYTPEVRHYTKPENGRLIWEETRYNVGRISLTKIKANLTWLIGNKNLGDK